MIKEVMPLVTIAIPTYNRADGYLKQTLDSALNQTYQNIEIIVADNCSTDNTESVVKAFSDPRIRYFKQKENIGANNNFNFAVEQAQGKYFLLLHDDDLIDEDFIETCMDKGGKNIDVGLIRTGTRIINAENKVKREIPNKTEGLSTEDFFRGWFKRETALFLCSTLFNTRRLKEIGGFKSKHNLFQDVMAEFYLAAKFGRVDIYDVKASFRKHADEMTYAAKVGDWCEDSLQLLDLMCDLVSENKALIRREGLQFLARRNYARVKPVKSPLKRLKIFLLVFKKFNYRYLPPFSFVFPRKRIIRHITHNKKASLINVR